MCKCGLEAAFSRRHDAGHTWIVGNSHAYRTSKRLEHGFSHVVGITRFDIVDMQGHPSVIHETLEKLAQ